jgi:hypothetical protein
VDRKFCKKIEEKIMQKFFWNDTKFRKNEEQKKFWRRNLEKGGNSPLTPAAAAQEEAGPANFVPPRTW